LPAEAATCPGNPLVQPSSPRRSPRSPGGAFGKSPRRKAPQAIDTFASNGSHPSKGVLVASEPVDSTLVAGWRVEGMQKSPRRSMRSLPPAPSQPPSSASTAWPLPTNGQLPRRHVFASDPHTARTEAPGIDAALEEASGDSSAPTEQVSFKELLDREAANVMGSLATDSTTESFYGPTALAKACAEASGALTGEQLLSPYVPPWMPTIAPPAESQDPRADALNHLPSPEDLEAEEAAHHLNEPKDTLPSYILADMLEERALLRREQTSIAAALAACMHQSPRDEDSEKITEQPRASSVPATTPSKWKDRSLPSSPSRQTRRTPSRPQAISGGSSPSSATRPPHRGSEDAVRGAKVSPRRTFRSAASPGGSSLVSEETLAPDSSYRRRRGCDAPITPGHRSSSCLSSTRSTPASTSRTIKVASTVDVPYGSSGSHSPMDTSDQLEAISVQPRNLLTDSLSGEGGHQFTNVCRPVVVRGDPPVPASQDVSRAVVTTATSTPGMALRSTLPTQLLHRGTSPLVTTLRSSLSPQPLPPSAANAGQWVRMYLPSATPPVPAAGPSVIRSSLPTAALASAGWIPPRAASPPPMPTASPHLTTRMSLPQSRMASPYPGGPHVARQMRLSVPPRTNGMAMPPPAPCFLAPSPSTIRIVCP